MAKETFSSLIDLFKNPSSSSVSTLMCDVCGNKLSVFRKKKPCAECKRQFCSQCLQRCRDRALRCKNCSVLTMRPPLRSALLDLRIKDLQHYLNQHNVSTRGCLEKEDLVNVLLRYASTPGNPPRENSGNPGNSGNSRNPPTVNSSYSSVNSGNRAGNSGTGPSVTITTSSSTSFDTSGQESNGAQMHFSQTVPGHGDSDSSSDTSFEIVQRPSSNENITSVPSSSSSTSVSENGSPGDTTSSTAVTTGVARVTPERQSENPDGSVTTPVTPASIQISIEETSQALGSISLTSQVNPDVLVTPDISIDSDVSNVDSQEVQRVHPLSQPVSQPNSPNNSSHNSPSLLRGTMASITSESDFEALSVKSLKDILHRHRVNYHGCCEKAELVDKAKRLYRDYCSSRAELEKLEMDALCKICMDAPVECVMLECGHMATCTDCGRQLSECPICRQFVVRIVRTFKA